MIKAAAILLIPFCAFSTTWNSDGSASDTQTQINNASSGDTVLLPASGSYTWSAAVSMPNTKYITLDLNGRKVTFSGASGQLSIEAHATGNQRVTNGNFEKSGNGYTDNAAPFKINDQRGKAGIRVDNISFTQTGISQLADSMLVYINGMGPGVMDHCTFTGMSWADEFIHIEAWGPADTTGWTVDSGNTLAGSANIFYIENCTFTQASSQAGVSWIQGYYGCRAVFRYNVFNHVSVDMHGTAGNIGARWWEFYMNTWSNTVSGTGSSPAMNMRAGSGVCWSNACYGSGYGLAIDLCEEDSGYPADYQIGRGINQTSDIACVWSNTAVSTVVDSCDAPAQAGMVALGRDVTNAVRSAYSAYTYPHPLISGGGGGGGTSGGMTFNAGTVIIRK